MSSSDGMTYGLVHGTIFVTTLYFSYISDPGSSLFSWHPFLMTVGMFLLLNEAVLMFSPHLSLIPKQYHKRFMMNLHVYTEVAAVVGFNVGFAAIYINKEENGKPHFTSWHGLLGLILAIIIMFQVALGSVAKYAKSLPVKVNVGKVKTWHNLVGALLILFSISNMVTACFTNYFVRQTHILLAYSFSAIFVIIYGFVSLRVFATNSRLKALFR